LPPPQFRLIELSDPVVRRAQPASSIPSAVLEHFSDCPDPFGAIALVPIARLDRAMTAN
jgi:hypothetical protein